MADAAGVTKPVIYKCYPNKDELLLALLDREEHHPDGCDLRVVAEQSGL